MISCRICGAGGDERPVESDIWTCNRCDYAGRAADAVAALFRWACDAWLTDFRSGATYAPSGGQWEGT